MCDPLIVVFYSEFQNRKHNYHPVSPLNNKTEICSTVVSIFLINDIIISLEKEISFILSSTASLFELCAYLTAHILATGALHVTIITWSTNFGIDGPRQTVINDLSILLSCPIASYRSLSVPSSKYMLLGFVDFEQCLEPEAIDLNV